MTFKKIVVGLDQSFNDSIIFARALEQAKPHSSSILIMHTLKAHPSTTEISLPIRQHTEVARDMYNILSRQHKERLNRGKRQAENWLDMYVQQAIAKGIPTQVSCPSGNPGLWLCEMSQRWGADLIVIGHRENHGLRSVGHNSVTQYVLQHAPCTVLVIQGELPTPELNYIDGQRPTVGHRVDQTKPVTTPATARVASQMFKV
jgi:nucleotide-binding universal stress UspA family protein